MKEPVWIERADALAIHELMLSQYGGMAGIRDEGMLASALAKPQNRFAYEKPSVAEMGASYAAGIILNHPFLDGNKRTGFMVAAAFMELNGFNFIADEVSAVERTLALAAGAIDEATYAKWLKQNSKKA
jgi:death-on-curing protein